MALSYARFTINSLLYRTKSCVSFLNGRLAVPLQQVCNEWTDARMRKDVRKRRVCSEVAPLKSRLQAMRKNTILPQELTEMATEELFKLPNDAIGKKIVWRCAVTSRPRGIVYRWRVSRIVFRHLSDYNKLAGVIRAKW